VTPLILYVIKRWPFDRRHPIRSVLGHSLAAVIIFCLNSAIYIPAIWSVLGPGSGSMLEAIWRVIMSEIHIGLVIYWLIFGIVQGLDYYLRYRAGELRAANLETRLAQAQLNALRMQLHPHFLFNTLNSVAVLMRKDIEAADRMLIQLSALLRVTLAANSAHEIRLRQELEILERYLENEKGGVIEIRAERRNGTIHLQVRDNGPGLKRAAGALSEGVGLSNSRSRLEHLYGPEGRFEVRNAEGGGVVVAAALPFHTETTIEVEAGE
jgi:LytS/YehU family sensor histidine kinase